MNNFYLVELNECGYDQFDSFVIAANTEEQAIEFLKGKYPPKTYSEVDWESGYTVKLLVSTNFPEPTEVISSYNAG